MFLLAVLEIQDRATFWRQVDLPPIHWPSQEVGLPKEKYHSSITVLRKNSAHVLDNGLNSFNGYCACFYIPGGTRGSGGLPGLLHTFFRPLPCPCSLGV